MHLACNRATVPSISPATSHITYDLDSI